MNKKTFIAGLLGMLSIVLGAFGAHGLKPFLSDKQFETYQLASHYQLVHSVVLLALSLLSANSNKLKWAFNFILFGILFFSGSLYFLAMSEKWNMNALRGFIGPVTPIGGVCFIVGWALIMLSALKKD